MLEALRHVNIGLIEIIKTNEIAVLFQVISFLRIFLANNVRTVFILAACCCYNMTRVMTNEERARMRYCCGLDQSCECVNEDAS